MLKALIYTNRTVQFFGAQTLDITVEIINLAKSECSDSTSGIAHEKIYTAFMEAHLTLHTVEFPKGYCYLAHPVACAAGIAVMNFYDIQQIEATMN